MAWLLAVATAVSACFEASATSLLRFSGCALARAVSLGLRAGDGVLRLLLGSAQHPLCLLLRLGSVLVGLRLDVGAELLGVGLRIGAQLGDLVVRLGALRLCLIIGQLEDLADALADLLVRRLAAGPRGRQL